MAESAPPSIQTNPSKFSEDLNELRGLLLAPEQTRIERLQERLDNPSLHARDVSRVLPDALAIRGAKDRHLSAALAPYVEEGFAAAVRKSPRAIVDAIAPIMGPAIRQAIVRTLQGMVQSLNYALEQSLSARGLRWRLEAWRTGRSFAEVVLLHTLQYRVEQVLLIHRETGLLLHHVTGDAVAVQDQHMVSGMLTAIQSYVQDSFGASPDQTLEHFQVGEWTVYVEQGSQALVAGVIRGTPPLTIRQHFRDVLDRIHVQQADALALYSGDSTPFLATQPLLESCLQSHYELPQRQHSWAISTLGILIVSGGAFWGWTVYQSHARWSEFLTVLKAEPGIVVTVAETTLGGYRLEGLRDPLAKDPASFLSDYGIDASHVSAAWSPYYALDSALIIRRAQMMLKPPKTVRVGVDGGLLVTTGSATVEWANDARNKAPFIPGVSGYQDDGLMTVSLSDLLAQINQTVVHFNSGSSIVEPVELVKLQAVLGLLRNLDQMASQLNRQVTLEISGSADESGPEAINRQLKEARAQAIRDIIGGQSFGTATAVTIHTDSPFLNAQRESRKRSADKRISLLHAMISDGPADSTAARP